MGQLQRSLLLVTLLAAGCLTMSDTETSEWGIGPDPACDSASSPFCWPDADRLALAQADGALLEALADPSDGDARDAAAFSAQGLAHRLEPDDLALLDSVIATPALPDPVLAEHELAELTQRIFLEQDEELLETYLSRIDVDALGGCPAGAACAHGGESMVPTTYPAAAQEVLRAFEESGPFGQIFVSLIISSHGFDRDTHALNARLFGSETLRMDEQIDRIAGRAQAMARIAGAVTGGVSLLGPLGVGVAIGGEEWLLMKIQIDALFRIADVYGVSLGEDKDRLMDVCYWTLFGDMGNGFVSGVPKIGVMMAARFGNALLAGGAKATAKAIVGVLTLGVGSVLGNAYLTGQRAQANAWGAAFQMRDWLGALSRGGSVQGDAAQRACMFRVVAMVAVADGTLSEDERATYQALLATADDAAAPPGTGLSLGEQRAHAALLADLYRGRVPATLGECEGTLDAASLGVRGIALGLAGISTASDGMTLPGEHETLQGMIDSLSGLFFESDRLTAAVEFGKNAILRPRAGNLRLSAEALLGVSIPEGTRTAFAAGMAER